MFNDRRVRYVAAGGVSAALYYGLFTVNWMILGDRVPYLAMAVLSSAATAVLTYPLYRRVVFRQDVRHGGPVRFYLVCLWSTGFVMMGLPLLVEVIHLHVLLALPLVIVVNPLVTYQLNRLWAFGKGG